MAPYAKHKLKERCFLSRRYVEEADRALEYGDIEKAELQLELAYSYEPRALEREEIRQRIEHLRIVDVDWPEATCR